MSGPFYFAWVASGTPFSVDLAVEDEQVFAVEIVHDEGDFPTLRIDVKNPRVGLLAAGRNLWCWLSWNNGAGITPLFNGRLIGVPEDLHNEVIRLQFVARPDDYNAAKAALADTMKVAPFWDPIWLQENLDDPDTVLEARAELWHIDRTSLEVTSSNIIDGEDGTLEVTEADHFYDDVSVTYGEAPLSRVKVTGTVTWTQKGKGEVDLNRRMVQAFQAAGSPVGYPFITSMTGQGLFDSWPEPGKSIGGGWSMAPDSSIQLADWVKPMLKAYVYTKPKFESKTFSEAKGGFDYVWGRGFIYRPERSITEQAISGYEQWSVVFPLGIYKSNFLVAYDAARKRSEQVSFTLEADVQPILVDPAGDDETKVDLASEYVDQQVDPNGAVPIDDLRRNSYFKTDRGQVSFQYLIMIARAKLLARARAVNVKFAMPWVMGMDLSCRVNVKLYDRRLPGGSVTGKVTGYTLSAGAGEQKCEVTIGCTVGYGNDIGPTDGDGDYADGHSEEYQNETGGTIAPPGVGDVVYQSFDDFDVQDADGVDLFNMTSSTVLKSLSIQDGVNAHLDALHGFDSSYTGDTEPQAVLKDHPTIVSLSLHSVTSRSFHTDFAPVVSKLMIPKTVDLEHA